MPMLNVSEEGIAAEKLLRRQAGALQRKLEESIRSLNEDYQENLHGLGAHSDSIRMLLEELAASARDQTSVRQLRQLLKRSIAIREDHRNTPFQAGVPPADDTSGYLAGVLGNIYDDGYRKMRTQNSDGQWVGDVFHPDKTVMPTKFNPRGLTFGQIIDDLQARFGLRYTGTPYREGYADFSQIALAQISLSDIVQRHVADGLCADPFTNGEAVDYDEIYAQRERNFRYADEIAANNQIPIPGLPDGYSPDDLEDWRKANLFTWDESYLNGYLLVPAELHNNISHTGLVGISGHLQEAERAITNRLRESAEKS